MIALDLSVFPVFAALLPDGKVLLELAIGDEDHLVQVSMPPTAPASTLAVEAVTTLDLDVLPHVAPDLAREIEGFIAEIRQRLIERAAREN